MNIIFFTCIFVIEQVYQNKLSTKAIGPGCPDWNGRLARGCLPLTRGRFPPIAALWRPAAAPPGPPRLHRQRRNAELPPGPGGGCSRLLHAVGTWASRRNGRVRAGSASERRCCGGAGGSWLRRGGDAGCPGVRRRDKGLGSLPREGRGGAGGNGQVRALRGSFSRLWWEVLGRGLSGT